MDEPSALVDVLTLDENNYSEKHNYVFQNDRQVITKFEPKSQIKIEPNANVALLSNHKQLIDDLASELEDHNGRNVVDFPTQPVLSVGSLRIVFDKLDGENLGRISSESASTFFIRQGLYRPSSNSLEVSQRVAFGEFCRVYQKLTQARHSEHGNTGFGEISVHTTTNRSHTPGRGTKVAIGGERLTSSPTCHTPGSIDNSTTPGNLLIAESNGSSEDYISGSQAMNDTGRNRNTDLNNEINKYVPGLTKSKQTEGFDHTFNKKLICDKHTVNHTVDSGKTKNTNTRRHRHSTVKHPKPRRRNRHKTSTQSQHINVEHRLADNRENSSGCEKQISTSNRSHHSHHSSSSHGGGSHKSSRHRKAHHKRENHSPPRSKGSPTKKKSKAKRSKICSKVDTKEAVESRGRYCATSDPWVPPNAISKSLWEPNAKQSNGSNELSISKEEMRKSLPNSTNRKRTPLTAFPTFGTNTTYHTQQQIVEGRSIDKNSERMHNEISAGSSTSANIGGYKNETLTQVGASKDTFINSNLTFIVIPPKNFAISTPMNSIEAGFDSLPHQRKSSSKDLERSVRGNGLHGNISSFTLPRNAVISSTSKMTKPINSKMQYPSRPCNVSSNRGNFDPIRLNPTSSSQNVEATNEKRLMLDTITSIHNDEVGRETDLPRHKDIHGTIQTKATPLLMSANSNANSKNTNTVLMTSVHSNNDRKLNLKNILSPIKKPTTKSIEKNNSTIASTLKIYSDQFKYKVNKRTSRSRSSSHGYSFNSTSILSQVTHSMGDKHVSDISTHVDSKFSMSNVGHLNKIGTRQLSPLVKKCSCEITTTKTNSSYTTTAPAKS